MKKERNLIVMTLVFALAFGFAGSGSVYAEEGMAMQEDPAMAAPENVGDIPTAELSENSGTVDAGGCAFTCGLITSPRLCPIFHPFCKCKWLPYTRLTGVCVWDK